MTDASTAHARPGVLQTALQAWRSTWDAVLQMPLAFVLPLAALAVLSGTLAPSQGVFDDYGQLLPGQTPGSAAMAALSAIAATALQSLVLAPLAIAIHRFVLLGERSAAPTLEPVGRVLRFAAWLTLLGALPSLADLLQLLPAPVADAAVIAALVAAVFVTVRLVLVFPGIALDPGGRPAQSGWRLTKGQFWRILAVVLVTELPVLIVGALAFLAAMQLNPGLTLAAAEASPVGAMLQVPATALGAAAASWLFTGAVPEPPQNHF